MLRRTLPLLALLAVPAAAAAEEPSFTLSGDTSFTGTGIMLLAHELPEVGRIRSLELRAEELEVFVGKRDGMESKLYDSAFVITSYDDRSYTLHNVTLRLERMTELGFVGIHLHDEDARVAFDSSAAAYTVHLRQQGEAYTMQTTGDATRHESRMDSAHFYHRHDEPYLHLSSPGRLEYQGSAMIQMYGVEVMLVAQENATRVTTGFTSAEGVAGPASLRFLSVRAANLTLVADSDAPWEMGMSEMAYTDTVVRPGQEEFLMIGIGQAPQPVPAPARAPAFPWLLVVGACVAGAGTLGGGGYLLLHRRARRVASAVHDPIECWDPEECLQRTKVHTEAENWARALEWTDRARDLAPTSARVHSTRAFLLERLDRPDEALAAYAEAALFDPSEGEHDVHAARLALLLGRPAHEAVTLVARGLSRTPALIHLVEEEASFCALRGEPLFDKALDEAWALHARELSRPEEGEDAES